MAIKTTKKKTKKETQDKIKIINREFKKALSTAIIAAAGFITAFAWRDLINEFFNEILSLRPIQGQLISTLVITFLAVIVIMAASKLASSEK